MAADLSLCEQTRERIERTDLSNLSWRAAPKVVCILEVMSLTLWWFFSELVELYKDLL